VALYTLLVPSALSAQQVGTIAGTVADAASSQPLSGVELTIEGMLTSGLSNADGRYLLLNVPAGTHTLRASLIGYGTEVVEVTLVAGETVTSDLRMSPSAFALDAVVVTVTGERRKRELGNAVSSIETAQVLEAAPVHTMSDLLQGRAAGLQLLSSTGASGMGSRIRIRGASSISLSNEPLLYVDGIRVDNSSGITVYAGGQSPSRLDDLNPEDIESIEIVKGPAAATLYGTEAANGVIRVTTKQGRPGAARWSVWSELGLVQDPTTYPLNYAGIDDGGGPFAEVCLLDFEVRGLCTQSSVRTYQPLNDPRVSPITDGRRSQLGVSVTGGSEQISFYVSAEREAERGPYELPDADRDTLEARGIPIDETVEHPQQLERVNVRANINAQVRPNTTLQVNAGYLTSDLSIMPNDNTTWGLFAAGLAGGTDVEDTEAAWGFLIPAESFGQYLGQRVERFTGSALAQSSPKPWLGLRATVGLDYNNRHDVLSIPRDLGVPGDADLGRRRSNYFNSFRYTLDASATATTDVTSTIGSETSVGIQFFRTRFEGTLSSGDDIVPGASSIGVAAETTSSERYSEDKTAGLFIQQTFDLNDRLFITGALRADDNSAFGRDFDLVYYPKAAVSWVASEEGFFPELSFLQELRLRAAWGRSGLQPGSTAAITTLDAFPVTDNGDQTVSGVRIGAVGNNELEPELSSEIEAGLDADLLSGRLGVELTYYRKTTTGALVLAPLAPSLGSADSRWVNVGDVLNEGIEAAISATPVTSDPFRWDLMVAASNNHNELLTLGEDIPRVGEGGPNFVPGYPLGGTWGRTIHGYDDADGNGILTANEIEVADTVEYNGPSLPSLQMSASSTFTLFGQVRIYAFLEHRGNYVAGNGSFWYHCRFRKCGALVDRSTPLWDQARAVAAVYHPSQSAWGYGEHVTFTKLREVSVSYTLPDAWAGGIGASRLAVTLAGRNLMTWTDFTGIDPEGNFNGQINFAQTEFLTQAPSRYWTLRLNADF
jgi:TonB-linked SusC/RagA family outer membrane protein